MNNVETKVQAVQSVQELTTTNGFVTHTFDFGEALKWLKDGQKVSRANWNGNETGVNLWVKLTGTNGDYDTNDFTTDVMIMHTKCENLVPWCISQSDVLSHDWFVLPTKQAAVV